MLRIEDLLTRRASDIDRDWKDQAIEFLQGFAKGQADKIKELEAALLKAQASVTEFEQEIMAEDDDAPIAFHNLR